MKKSKQLKALLTENPQLQDVVSSLEAQIATLSAMNTSASSEFDSLEAENEELEELVALKSRELMTAHNDYVSLNSRYQMSLKALVKLSLEKTHDK